MLTGEEAQLQDVISALRAQHLSYQKVKRQILNAKQALIVPSHSTIQSFVSKPEA